jgi:hypothetical protein
MISLARQPTLRDKAWARRLTGDLYLRLNEPTQAAQEFNQLLVVQRSAGHYRIDPHLVRHWRAVAAGDTDTAAKAFNDAMAELAALPKTGRLGLEAAMGLSAALVHAGKMDQALSMIAARQLDTTIAHNRDAIASTAWSFVAFRCRDASIAPPAVLEALLWINPLHTAVALDLAIHDQWDLAIAWSKATADSRTLTDSLVAITDIAASQTESAEVFSKIEAAVASGNPVVALRVKGAVAAAQKNSAKLDACIADFAKLAPAAPVQMPAANQLVQDDVVDRDTFLLQAIAVAEVVRAGVTAGKTEQAAAAMTRLESELAAVAPSATAVRILINEIADNEAAFRRQLATELRVSDETTFNSMFRNYRRHLEQMARITEDRRLLQILLFSRVIRAGGINTIQTAMAASPELTQDLLLDELSGLMAVSARKTNQQFPEVFTPDPSLKKGRARFGNAALIVNIAATADKAWASHQTNLSASLKAMEKEAVSRNPLPGLCQAIASELVEFAALSTPDPGAVLTAISQMQNGVWREESYIIAGRVFADRKVDDKADAWLSSTKVPAMEHIALLYGVSLGILERPVPAAKNPGDTKNVSQQADTGRR